MTCWFLIVLLALLPLQFSWTAAPPYCAHESGPTSLHVGHHAHAHRISPTDAQHSSPDPKSSKKSLALD